MAYWLRSLHQALHVFDLTPDWLGAGVTVGSSKADTLTHTGGSHLILGVGGRDTITVEGVFSGLGNAVFGGAGDDTIKATGSRNLISGDGGNDFIQMGRGVGADNNYNVVLGGAGDDAIESCGKFNFISGGEGNDTINVTNTRFSYGEVNNVLEGGAGNDRIISDGIGSVLSGGRGDDYLLGSAATMNGFGTVLATGDLIGTAQTMNGGSGRDYFRFNTNSELIVEGDQDGVLSQGDEITGLLSVVTDYQKGEGIDIDAGGNSMVSSKVTLGGIEEGVDHLRMGGYSHAVVRGDMNEPGHFVVDEDGGDTMIVYNWTNDSSRFAMGSVVLLDYADEVTVVNYQDGLFLG
ncbi:hypothetical protein BKE38_00295 [Pseudoroseomonas deserti]|uniref:Calcium-binding protein n=1 Tax=Teichococcus deserti TaxID=1817963 RepID=A0A1V2H8G6_9PROT|nr:hypothetical protein [Pseudoroseomonas deserti]ONG59148.1 hypothetical protein BKE38_00295 [Pseudoroseomonas deserti]